MLISCHHIQSHKTFPLIASEKFQLQCKWKEAEGLPKRYTHTHPFNGPFSGTTRVSRYQKGKTSLDFTEARDGEWQWHQQGRMQVCTLLQTDNHTSTPPLSFFTGRMPFPLPNQQRQSTEGKKVYSKIIINIPYMLTSLL